MKTRIFILTVVLIAFMGQSCSDFLKEELVRDVTSGSYYATEAGLEDAVKAAYSEMKPFWGPERGFTFCTLGTDIRQNGADGSHKYYNFYDNQLNPSAGYVRDTWRDFYRGINQCNAVLNRAEGLEMDPAVKEQRFGEVRFLRALYYFTLVKFYGDIHLSLEETEGIETEANKTPKTEIITTAIIPDLEYAISKLPDSQADNGRATKPAAQFLLAEVYLFKGWQGGSASDFGQAETLLTSVIDDYGFVLEPEFRDLWGLNERGEAPNIATAEKSAEIIFSVKMSKQQVDEGLDGEGNRGHLYFLMEYDKMPGMTRDIANGRPWKRFAPTEYGLSLWDRENDARYDHSYKHVWYANNEGNIPTWSQAEASAGYCDPGQVGQPKFTKGDTAIFIPGPGKDAMYPPEVQAKTRYLILTNNEYTSKLYPTLNKWIDDSRPDRQKEQGQRDFYLMRLGDAYLLRAEARMKQNDNEGAAADINMVRVRAAWPGKEDAMKITADDVDLDFLLEERARELEGECKRWFDLTRTNTLVERVRAHNPTGGPNIQDYHVVRPIPQDQIDRSSNEYQQNPGYPGS